MTVHPSADVADSAAIDETAAVWHYAQVRENAVLGPGVIVGRGAYIGVGVAVGANSKIQHYALVYEPAELEGGVFIGPAAVLTNDQHPRAVDPDGTRKSASDWQPVGVRIREGASIGANAVCVAPLEVGRWAMVAAGAVVVQDVPDFALVAGVPARQLGWIGRSGHRLAQDPQDSLNWICPVSGERYRLISTNVLHEA